MSLGKWVGGFLAASAGALVYGALVESNRLVVERRVLRLPRWPIKLSGYRIALLADFHLRDEYTFDLGSRAIAAALDADPDMVVLAGDFVGYWKPHSQAMLRDLLRPLVMLSGRVVAVPGNHDYWDGDPSLLLPVLEPLNIRLLRNQVWRHHGVQWMGIDSTGARRCNPIAAMRRVSGDEPIVAVWHEPDSVRWLPNGAALMLSGHSHGGQWIFPWGWAPMSTKYGHEYTQGFYPDARTPLYVSRGLGTTGPPARFCCPPEVSILELHPE